MIGLRKVTASVHGKHTWAPAESHAAKASVQGCLRETGACCVFIGFAYKTSNGTLPAGKPEPPPAFYFNYVVVDPFVSLNPTLRTKEGLSKARVL